MAERAVEPWRCSARRGRRHCFTSYNCEKGGQWLRGLALLRPQGGATLAPAGGRPLSLTWVSASEQGQGLRQPARALLCEMLGATLDPTIIRSSLWTGACEKCGQWQPARSPLSEMWVAKLAQTVLRSYIATSACEKCGQWPLARSLPRERCEKHRQRQRAVERGGTAVAARRGVKEEEEAELERG